MKISRIPALILTTGLLQLTAPCALLAQTVFTDAGAGSVAEVTAARDAFRAAIGGGTTPGANGSFGGVRFEINWDGVPNTFSGPNNFPANFFNVNSPRGVVFNTPGTGFEVSASALSGTPAKFGNIDPSFTGRFATFSPERLFTSLGSNVFDVSFFLPGASTAALTNGFAAIFTDVDFPNLTSITYFNATNEALGTWYAPVHAGNQTLSFLGVVFDAPIVSRVRVTLGIRRSIQRCRELTTWWLTTCCTERRWHPAQRAPCRNLRPTRLDS